MDSFIVQLSILGPAMLAGTLILSTHVLLGREVLRRGIIFLDLAIAQVAALGLILANFIGIASHDEGHYAILTNIIAISAAITGASLIYQFHRLAAHLQEALIGTLFILAATASILVLSKDPHGGERLKEMLVGQILWVEYPTLISTAIVYSAVLAIWVKWREQMAGYIFYPVFAVTITLSTQLVGVYLVFASLIVPAVATQHTKKPITYAYLIGFLGYLVGLLVSALFDFPSGAMITWCLAVIAALFFLLTKRGKVSGTR